LNADRQTTELAVLFADISDSTRLYDTLGDARAKTVVDECIAIMRDIVGRCSGRVIKTIGDEVMCVLPDARSGLLAASDMQARIAALPAVSGAKRAVRGPVIEEENDVFGDTVNLAARMAGLAKAAQIITTLATVEQLPRALRETTRRIAALSIKGKGEDIEVCEVIWEVGEDLTMTAASAGVAPAARFELHLAHGSGELVLRDADAAVSLGRDAACGVVLAERKASRVHARIERRRDKFFLIDQSTNGTFVTFDGETELVLRREEVMLRGRGRITFGHSAAEAGGETVSFTLR
jgi:class 3 adenylate cyclase